MDHIPVNVGYILDSSSYLEKMIIGVRNTTTTRSIHEYQHIQTAITWQLPWGKGNQIISNLIVKFFEILFTIFQHISESFL